MTRINRRAASISQMQVLLMSPMLLLVIMVHVGVGNCLSTDKSTRVTLQICQNKDCCQRFQGKAFSLLETMEYLLSDKPSSKAPQIYSSGCLSQCGKGPNVLFTDHGSERLYHQVDSVHSAAAILELACPDIAIHPTLVAGIKVMERFERASNLEERATCLDSVILALDKKPELAVGPVVAHAYVLRAQLRLRQRLNPEALRDAIHATELNPSNAVAWRVLADVQEAVGNKPAAIQALSKWGEANPAFRTKATNEIQRLLQTA